MRTCDGCKTFIRGLYNKEKLAMPGTMVISLDFELMWGVLNKRTIENYGKNVLTGKDNIPTMLSLFNKHGIHATWGIVGFLHFENFDDMENRLPIHKPIYKKMELSPYVYLKDIKKQNEDYYFAKDLIKEIASYPGQEIATHTFSHYYCKEDGQDIISFEADIEQAVKIAEDNGYKVKSIIFPKNQLNEDYKDVLKKYKIRNYRGNDKGFFYLPCSEEKNSLLRRAVHLLDAYFNLTGFQCYKYDEILQNGLNNIRSSRFLRPYNKKLFFLEPLKVLRIKRQMRYAAKRGKVFHLWWHPHNFGENVSKNFKVLEELLEYFKKLEKCYGFQSRNMQELGWICDEFNNSGRGWKK